MIEYWHWTMCFICNIEYDFRFMSENATSGDMHRCPKCDRLAFSYFYHDMSDLNGMIKSVEEELI
jgi:hypothetical protein